MSSDSSAARGAWHSRSGFLLAAAGSAVGLGNIWRFPYITGENGGGLFVLIYLGCVALLGLPILIGEVLIGRAARRSAVSAFHQLAGPGSPWAAVGLLGVAAAMLILSFYSVVAGWALHYAQLSARGALAGLSPERIGETFGALTADPVLSTFWMVVFMGLTTWVVSRGVHRGIELCSQILMPVLLVLLLVLLVRVSGLSGFGPGLAFVFGLHASELTAAGILEALGHAFFTLSVGVGGLLAYGSYLDRGTDVPKAGLAIAGLDTLIALLACAVLFPIIFTHGQDPTEGPGLIFVNLPIAFSTLPGGNLLAATFFLLLVLAALTSTISLLEVVTAWLIDQRGWSRRRATLGSAGAITLLAVPSALSGGPGLFGEGLRGRLGGSWLDLAADVSSNWMVPLGGLGIALFAAWRWNDLQRRREFTRGSRLARWYGVWLGLLRWLVPAAVVLVFLHAVGAI
jgi:NSS family neurotransmitter:Na+ symporter